MSYTHYWRQEAEGIQDKDWALIAKHVRQVITKSHVPVLYEHDTPAFGPSVTPNKIRFNGFKYEGHETFYLTRKASDFTFCKTAGKPYDILVVAALIIANAVAPDKIVVTSDGNVSDWQEGLDLVKNETDLKTAAIPKGIRK